MRADSYAIANCHPNSNCNSHGFGDAYGYG
jgi:hypothetical protein